MVIMIMSGWRIYNSEPIFPFRFPIALTLGGSFDGSVDLHNEDGLAGALQWHFAGMWLLAINGIVYVAYGILSEHFRRAFLPVGPTAVLRDAHRRAALSAAGPGRRLQGGAVDPCSACIGRGGDKSYVSG